MARRPIKSIYVASSWRNEELQQSTVVFLRALDFEVYDFRHPRPGNDGFHWSEIDEDWKNWNREQFRRGLSHPIASKGFNLDFHAMEQADACVLVMPCGRSAHLAAGYFVGAGKPLVILLVDGEPELMYRMADSICISLPEVGVYVQSRLI